MISGGITTNAKVLTAVKKSFCGEAFERPAPDATCLDAAQHDVDSAYGKLSTPLEELAFRELVKGMFAQTYEVALSKAATTTPIGRSIDYPRAAAEALKYAQGTSTFKFTDAKGNDSQIHLFGPGGFFDLAVKKAKELAKGGAAAVEMPDGLKEFLYGPDKIADGVGGVDGDGPKGKYLAGEAKRMFDEAMLQAPNGREGEFAGKTEAPIKKWVTDHKIPLQTGDEAAEKRKIAREMLARKGDDFVVAAVSDVTGEPTELEGEIRRLTSEALGDLFRNKGGTVPGGEPEAEILVEETAGYVSAKAPTVANPPTADALKPYTATAVVDPSHKITDVELKKKAEIPGLPVELQTKDLLAKGSATIWDQATKIDPEVATDATKRAKAIADIIAALNPLSAEEAKKLFVADVDPATGALSFDKYPAILFDTLAIDVCQDETQLKSLFFDAAFGKKDKYLGTNPAAVTAREELAVDVTGRSDQIISFSNFASLTNPGDKGTDRDSVEAGCDDFSIAQYNDFTGDILNPFKLSGGGDQASFKIGGWHGNIQAELDAVYLGDGTTGRAERVAVGAGYEDGGFNATISVAGLDTSTPATTNVPSSANGAISTQVDNGLEHKSRVDYASLAASYTWPIEGKTKFTLGAKGGFVLGFRPKDGADLSLNSTYDTVSGLGDSLAGSKTSGVGLDLKYFEKDAFELSGGLVYGKAGTSIPLIGPMGDSVMEGSKWSAWALGLYAIKSWDLTLKGAFAYQSSSGDAEKTDQHPAFPDFYKGSLLTASASLLYKLTKSFELNAGGRYAAFSMPNQPTPGNPDMARKVFGIGADYLWDVTSIKELRLVSRVSYNEVSGDKTLAGQSGAVSDYNDCGKDSETNCSLPGSMTVGQKTWLLGLGVDVGITDAFKAGLIGGVIGTKDEEGSDYNWIKYVGASLRLEY